MKHFTRHFLATICLLTFAGHAGASSIELIAETPKTAQVSVVHFGKPLDCKVEICPKKEEEVAAPAPVRTDKPLVDAYGMPTNMPTLIRGSETTQEITLTVPRKIKPVSTPPSESSQTPRPAGEEVSGVIKTE